MNMDDKMEVKAKCIFIMDLRPHQNEDSYEMGAILTDTWKQREPAVQREQNVQKP
jgi:hypothetical protein